MTEVRWLEDEELWEAKLVHMVPGTGDLSRRDREKLMKANGRQAVYLNEETVRAKVVCSAAGGFVEPNNWPESILGRDQFEGDIFHSGRWNHDVDLKDKDVIVVGTGCSAAQFVPLLTQDPYNVKSVTQVMRSPPWVIPKPAPPFVGEEWWENKSQWWFTRVPGLSKLVRTLIFLYSETDFYNHFGRGPKSINRREKVEATLIEHMKKTVPEKYWEMLTPNYSVGCKRRVIDANWFPSLNDPKIELTTKPLTSIQPRGVTLGPGRTYPSPEKADCKVPTDEVHLPADTIILANGFEIETWLAPLKVIGKKGFELQDVWRKRGGPQAYMGNAMDGFPNFFIIFGPNTATGHSSVILASENMVEYTLQFISRILRGEVKTFEVKKEKEIAWTNDIQDKLKNTVWMSACRSWYKTSSGWNATAYPYGVPI